MIVFLSWANITTMCGMVVPNNTNISEKSLRTYKKHISNNASYEVYVI